MKQFRVPLVATAVVFVLMVVIGVASMGVIYNSSGSNRKKAERAGMLGTGIATVGCIAIAPFWFYTAAQIGKERRKKKAQARQ